MRLIPDRLPRLTTFEYHDAHGRPHAGVRIVFDKAKLTRSPHPASAEVIEDVEILIPIPMFRQMISRFVQYDIQIDRVPSDEGTPRAD